MKNRPTTGSRSDTRDAPVAAQARNFDDDSRTVELAFSSEAKVSRWYGTEVLSHAKGAVDMARMHDGAAVLVNHDPDQHVGVIESARIDSDGVGRAVVRFGSSTQAEQVFRDIKDGIRRHTSVGYAINEVDETRAADGSYDVTVKRWTPFEVSITPTPADATVGVGRSDDGGIPYGVQSMNDQTDAPDVRDESESPDVGGGVETRSADMADAARGAVAEAEAKRKAREDEIGAMRKLADKYGLAERCEALIETDGTLDDMKEAVRVSVVHAKPTPVPAVRGVMVTGGAPRYKALRAFKAVGEEGAYRMGQWARATVLRDEKAARWCNENGIRAGVTNALAKGGAVVPDEMSQAIIDLREQYGVARRLVRVMPMGSDTMVIPRRVGGLTAYAIGQEDAITESDKSWNQVQLVARKWGIVSRFSTDYAEDAVIDVAEDLAGEMGYTYAEKEDDCLFNGDGTSTYHGIVGIRTKIVDGNHAAGAIDAATGTDNLSEVDADDLASLRAKLPVYASMNAKWIVHQAGKAVVFDQLQQAAGGNTMTDIAGRPVPAYLGDEIVVSQQMFSATTGTTGNNVAMLLYGDLMKAVTLGDRRGFTLDVSHDRYFEYDQVAIKSTCRFDIVTHDLGDATNAGPVVALVGKTS